MRIAAGMRSTSAITMAAIVVAVSSLAACGSDSGSASSPRSSTAPTTPDANGAVTAFRTFLAAYQAPDPAKACALQTSEYTATTLAQAVKDGYVKVGATCEGVVLAAHGLIKAFGANLTPKSVTVESRHGDEAKVRVVYDSGDSGMITMTFKDGEWLVAAEDDGGAESSASASASASAQAARWLGNWCAVKKGQTRQKAIDLMGEPTTEYTIADDATPQISWELGPYRFTAFLDTDNIVKSFWANYDGLGKTDRAKLSCPATR